MPAIVCELGQINGSAKCPDRGGFYDAYWTENQSVDWDTMFGDPLLFNPTTGQILDYAMVGGATFNRLTFDLKTAFYDFTYTSETDLFNLLLTMNFKGQDNDRKNALMSALQCCDVIFHLFANDGTQRVVGKDYNGLGFRDLLTPLRITRLLDSSGQLSTSKARVEMDLGGEGFFAPLFSTMDVADIPLV